VFWLLGSFWWILGFFWVCLGVVDYVVCLCVVCCFVLLIILRRFGFGALVVFVDLRYFCGVLVLWMICGFDF